MDAGINNVIYMELHSGPKMANGTCGKTMVAGTIDRGSTVLKYFPPFSSFVKIPGNLSTSGTPSPILNIDC
jgi:hypothetical protein